MFDDPCLTKKLCAKVRAGLRLRMLVDKAQLKKKTSTAKRSLERVDTVRKAGAEVYLCSGLADDGCFPAKPRT